MQVDQALAGAVTRFVDEVSLVLEVVANQVPTVGLDRLREDVTQEAFNLAAGFIDSDGLETDDELWAFIAAFGPRYGGNLVRATPQDLRKAGVVTGKAAHLAHTSTLFDILVGADARHRTRHAVTYYERAMEIAHVVASLDAHVSRTELLAIERYRTVLLEAMARQGTRGGAPRRDAGDPGSADGASPTEGSSPTPATTAGPASDAAARPGGPGPGATADRAPAVQVPPRPLDELLADLEALIGLDDVKREVRLVADLIQVQNLRRDRGLPTLETSRHLVFAGNPGTGKTTVARLLAEIYRTLGVVSGGHLVETDRSGLVAGFVGQTATRVAEAFDRADGGVLLIDEAYALVRGSEQDFGREAIDTIVKEMEDRREELVVIVAGYPDEMDRFMDANPGLRSRFPKTIEFPDYTTEELVAIFEKICADAHYRLTDQARQAVSAWLESFPRGKGFGNGRLSRNLFEDAVTRHATRVVGLEAPTDDDLVELVAADIPGPDDGPRHREPSADTSAGDTATGDTATGDAFLAARAHP